jgi:two-component system sensor histidine kinase/response regulator
MDGYLSKPIRPQELDEVLELYIGRGHEATAIAAPERPVQSHVATEELLERIDGDREFLAELLELFRGDCPELMRSAEAAIAAEDAANLQRTGHALKGALSNLSANTAAELAGSLEIMGGDGDFKQATATLNELAQELTLVLETLQGLCLESVR